jgi:hypothetical protein
LFLFVYVFAGFSLKKKKSLSGLEWDKEEGDFVCSHFKIWAPPSYAVFINPTPKTPANPNVRFSAPTDFILK